MKLFLLSVVFIPFNTFSQAEIHVSLLGTKPKISVNGDSCAILNQQFSCVARTCDPVTIYTGDSVLFCTEANIDLQTDTSYWMKWKFTGCSNYPDSVMDYTPTNLPRCYYPIWNTPGVDTVHIYYNGFLSAYPSSDCWNEGPSHWIIVVDVLPLGIEEASQQIGNVFPNPATHELNIDFYSSKGNLELYSVLGEKINSYELINGKNKINLSEIKPGMYLYKLSDKEGIVSANKLFVIK